MKHGAKITLIWQTAKIGVGCLRSKFHLSEVRINELLYFIKQNGIDSSRFPYAGEMPDEDDRVFYEICLSKEDSFLVTGNLKHFPKEPQVITAAEMMEILDNEL